MNFRGTYNTTALKERYNQNLNWLTLGLSYLQKHQYTEVMENLIKPLTCNFMRHFEPSENCDVCSPKEQMLHFP